MVDMIDISNYNTGVIFPDVAASGVQAIYMHGFEYHPTATFPAQWGGCRLAGMQRGAYCFGRPTNFKASDQATQFMDYVESFGFGGSDFMVLDFETTGTVEWIVEFMETVRGKGHGIALYISTSFLFDTFNGDSRLSPYPLIIADYSQNDGNIHPIQHDITGWKVWAHQYTSVGTVPGVPGNCDCNVFLDNHLNPGGESMNTAFINRESDPYTIFVTDGIQKRHVEPDEWNFSLYVLGGKTPPILTISQQWWDSIPTATTTTTTTIDQTTINNMATAIANAIATHLHGTWSAT